MSRKNNRKGFTLIEMLIVIAIIAVLVAIIVPAVGSYTEKSKAATDASNLRTTLGLLNIHVVNGKQTVEEIIDASLHPVSKTFPGAILCAIYERPGFIDVYYVDTANDKYYGLDYLSEIALNGTDSPALATISTDKPTVPGTWYEAGAGEITD